MHHSIPRCFRHVVVVVLCALLVAVSAVPVVASISIDTVAVGNPGNAGRYVGGGVFLGAVDYDYRIGTFEVTNSQYAAFLNAKAKSDPLELFHLNMQILAQGGISRSGSPGNYVYTVKPNFSDKPVNAVSWYDAVRFVNWLHNGQGAGDTETGSYTLLGGTATPINGATITRNPGATWVLPTEDEWHKAAYYNGSGGYGQYATQSNSLPTSATATSGGDIANPGANVANHNGIATWNNTSPGTGNVTTVGSAGPLSASHYGTYDQNGNVNEWLETVNASGNRGIRGGAYNINPSNLSPTNRNVSNPTLGNSPTYGFRVAYIHVVPEAGSLAIWIVLGLTISATRRRK